MLHLKLVLESLVAQSFVAKISKCMFAVMKVDYLGHVISAKGVTPDPEKIYVRLAPSALSHYSS